MSTDGRLKEHLITVSDRWKRVLVGRGYRLSDVAIVIASIEEEICRNLANCSLADTDLKVQVKGLYATILLAKGFHIPAEEVSNILHVRGHISEREAVCLWPGMLYDQSPSLEGMWQWYVDLRSIEHGRPIQLPEVVNRVFGSPEGRDYEICNYCEQQLKLGLENEDPLTLTAWALVKGLDGVHAPGDVHNSLRRGYYTLLSQILKDVYDAIDKYI